MIQCLNSVVSEYDTCSWVGGASVLVRAGLSGVQRRRRAGGSMELLGVVTVADLEYPVIIR